MSSADIYNSELTKNVYYAYYNKTSSYCKIVYYENIGKWVKCLRQINFSRKDIDPVKCVLTFRKIASKYNENIPYEPSKIYENGVYTYYKKPYEGEITVLDMNSAYLWALSQPLADFTTRTECDPLDVVRKKFDFYSFENELHCHMYYKEDINNMQGAFIWEGVKIYGYKSKIHYEKTAQELYRLKCEVDKEKYKNVANIAVGCMHKRSGKQNNTTLAASLYAYFAWHIDDLVAKFKAKGYNVIMVTTDSIKIVGKYNQEDKLVKIGNGLGEFKIEYTGPGKYLSVGHYEEDTVKWKGKPEYMRNGFNQCNFIDNIESERRIYEKYAIC
jgi:hypothetical protein